MRTFSLQVQLADGLDPHEAGRSIAEQVSAALADRSAAEQSRMPSAAESVARHTRPRPISDSPQA
jgi:hypothetical protein